MILKAPLGFPFQDVHQGDFLEIEVINEAVFVTELEGIKRNMNEEEAVISQTYVEGEGLGENNGITDELLQTVNVLHKDYWTNPVTRLLSESFDVLVFSLVLSYLPTQRQRWDCCIKANRLLRKNGLLLLIESDSAHEHRNSHQIRAWKNALHSIGFIRYRYQKLMHLHCMAFRKKESVCQITEDGNFVDNSNMMFIPQDFHDEDDDELECAAISLRTEDEDQEISSIFAVLPDGI